MNAIASIGLAIVAALAGYALGRLISYLIIRTPKRSVGCSDRKKTKA